MYEFITIFLPVGIRPHPFVPSWVTASCLLDVRNCIILIITVLKRFLLLGISFLGSILGPGSTMDLFPWRREGEKRLKCIYLSFVYGRQVLKLNGNLARASALEWRIKNDEWRICNLILLLPEGCSPPTNGGARRGWVPAGGDGRRNMPRKRLLFFYYYKIGRTIPFLPPRPLGTPPSGRRGVEYYNSSFFIHHSSFNR